jgi:hypothetical protein
VEARHYNAGMWRRWRWPRAGILAACAGVCVAGLAGCGPAPVSTAGPASPGPTLTLFAEFDGPLGVTVPAAASTQPVANTAGPSATALSGPIGTARPAASRTPRPTAAEAATLTPPATAAATATDTGATGGTPTPAASATATTAVSGTGTAVPLRPVISAANAVSVTEVAVFGPALATLTGTVTATARVRLEQVVWGPARSGGPALIAVAGAPGVQVYDRTTGQLTQPITTSAWAMTLAYSLSGQAVAAGTVNATVEVYDLRTGALSAVLGGPGVRVEQVRYLPVPGNVLPTGYAVVSLGTNNVLHFWDVARQAYLGPLDLGLGAAHTFDLSARAGGGRQWLAAAAGSTVRAWALPDLLTAAPDFQAVTPAFALAQPAPITALALSADGRWLAVGNSSGVVLLWDLTGDRAAPAARLDQQGSPAEQLAFTPGGGVLASAHGDRLIRLWAVGAATAGAAGAANSLHPLATLAGTTDRLTSLAFSADGRELASTGWEGLVRVWGVGE